MAEHEQRDLFDWCAVAEHSSDEVGDGVAVCDWSPGLWVAWRVGDGWAVDDEFDDVIEVVVVDGVVSPPILCGRCQIHGIFTNHEWRNA